MFLSSAHGRSCAEPYNGSRLMLPCPCDTCEARSTPDEHQSLAGDLAEWEKVVQLDMMAAMRLTHRLSPSMVRILLHCNCHADLAGRISTITGMQA